MNLWKQRVVGQFQKSSTWVGKKEKAASSCLLKAAFFHVYHEC